MDEISTDLIVKAYLSKDRNSLFEFLPLKDLKNKGRHALHMVLERIGLIKPFLHHPFHGGDCLPGYFDVIHEPMWIEKIIYRFEILNTNTLLEDFALMITNCMCYDLYRGNQLQVTCWTLWNTFIRAFTPTTTPTPTPTYPT